jgi:hypothetical protein
MEDVERRDQVGGTRQALLSGVESTLLRYNKLLLNAQQLVEANRALDRDYNSVASFVNHKKPLLQGDDDLVRITEDLITLQSGRSSAWIDEIMEEILLRLLPRSTVKYVFCSKVQLSPCIGRHRLTL